MTQHLSDEVLADRFATPFQWTIQGAGSALLATAPNLQSAIVHAYELESANNVVHALRSAEGIEIDTDQRYRLMKQFRLVR
jgi:hypothetical protein